MAGCAASDDFYQQDYEGLYCVGCEQFYIPAELQDGRCVEHGTEPEHVRERNWFFRLSRYQDQLTKLISTGELRIEPAARRNEVAALGYGNDPDDYRRWWTDSDARVHVIGKGILRFHAVYWPAMLLSAGELPITIYVHEYLTAYGQKISKSLG